MRDGAALLLGAAAGALVGGAIGWLFLTPEGRRRRAELEPRLIELAQHAAALRDAIVDLERAARQGLQALEMPRHEEL
ncbi:MAG TPA: hypothetical protein VF198_14995 [Vicinamibacterales bacterium]